MLWEHYICFLSNILNKVDEPNLARYVKIMLQKSRTQADETGLATDDVYLQWAQSFSSVNDSIKILSKACERYPASSKIWFERIKLGQSIGVHTEIEALFSKALLTVGVDRTVPSRNSERGDLWKLYLEWLCEVCHTTGNGPDSLEFAERRFKESLSPAELGGTEKEDELLEVYLRFSAVKGGTERVRAAYDRLISFRQRSPLFFKLCIDYEMTSNSFSPRKVDEDGDSVMGDNDAESGLDETIIRRIRRLHELRCEADKGSVGRYPCGFSRAFLKN
jgi:hypothetical protein